MTESERKKILDVLKRLQYSPYKDLFDRPTGALSFKSKDGMVLSTTLCNADDIIPAFKKELKKLLKDLTEQADTGGEWLTNGNVPDEPIDGQQNWGIFG